MAKKGYKASGLGRKTGSGRKSTSLKKELGLSRVTFLGLLKKILK